MYENAILNRFVDAIREVAMTVEREVQRATGWLRSPSLINDESGRSR
jgi:hypothetical protein